MFRVCGPVCSLLLRCDDCRARIRNYDGYCWAAGRRRSGVLVAEPYPERISARPGCPASAVFGDLGRIQAAHAVEQYAGLPAYRGHGHASFRCQPSAGAECGDRSTGCSSGASCCGRASRYYRPNRRHRRHRRHYRQGSTGGLADPETSPTSSAWAAGDHTAAGVACGRGACARDSGPHVAHLCRLRERRARLDG